LSHFTDFPVLDNQIFSSEKFSIKLIFLFYGKCCAFHKISMEQGKQLQPYLIFDSFFQSVVLIVQIPPLTRDLSLFSTAASILKAVQVSPKLCTRHERIRHSRYPTDWKAN
jgi:hypothetical protein